MSINYDFKPRTARTTANGDPERREPPRTCQHDDCGIPAVFGSRYCSWHAMERRQQLEAEMAAQRKAAKTEPTYHRRPVELEADERVPYVPTRFKPPQTELERARWRYQLAPELSDQEVLALHRANPPKERGVS